MLFSRSVSSDFPLMTETGAGESSTFLFLLCSTFSRNNSKFWENNLDNSNPTLYVKLLRCSLYESISFFF